jgi:phospholipid/cholesterol/gamma-HCH transport system ATP-binding protein
MASASPPPTLAHIGGSTRDADAKPPAAVAHPALEVEGLAVGFGETIIQQNLSFRVEVGSVFAIMGRSGSGKSTLFKALIGLLRPRQGAIRIGREDYWAASEARRAKIDQGLGVLFQSGALWSSMTLAQNVALPLRMLTRLDGASIQRLSEVKLALVGLAGAGNLMPSELSGGMVKRAGLARALSLDPAILMLDEPSSGLDPITAKRLDDLILELRDGFGMTIVLVSHDLPSLFAICDDGVFLDGESMTAIAHGAPRRLRDECENPIVHAFMRRERRDADVDSPGARHDGN